ncbi:MAG: glycosyltransferase [Nanoarchaeota archaeon]|nr:glycosyltransferase [Nanoarchaeota archaeon]
MKKISIIIPYKIFDRYVKECLEGCNRLNYDNFEIILLPDEKTSEDKKYTTIETGKVKPSKKRNIGVKKAKGEIIAFLDSDAYPRYDWLRNAVKYFEDDNVGIVGGPNLTPKNVNIWEKISGDCLGMFVCSGKAAIRYKIGKEKKYVEELPSCNLLIRKELFMDFDETLLTAEDTKLCFQVKERGRKILYAPDVVVYHHRRDGLLKHLKQMWIYGRDVAFLLKKKFSFDKVYYGLLSLWVLGLIIGGILSYFHEIFRLIYSGVVLFYLIFIFILSLLKNFRRSFLIFLTTIFTHIVYGIGFIYGILK